MSLKPTPYGLFERFGSFFDTRLFKKATYDFPLIILCKFGILPY